MRLNFNVLWIDDLPQHIESFQHPLRLKAEEEGFKLTIVQAQSVDEAMSYLADDVFLDDIDLVVVDYNLGTGRWGDDAVRQIRYKVPYKDIIFYSAIETTDLREKMLEQKTEGVFCSYREDLSETLVGVFEALVKKVLDIDHCRGIVMGATSDIDSIVNECLQALNDVLAPSAKITASTYILKKLDDRLKTFNTIRGRLEKGMSMEDMLKNHEAIPAADRVKLLKKMLSLRFPDTELILQEWVTKYINEVPHQRNILGHARLVAPGGKRTLVGDDVKEITPEELKEFRRVLIFYREKFEELLAILSSTVSEDDEATASTTVAA